MSTSPPLPSTKGGQPPPALADGRYEIRGFLGEGARKAVYLAYDGRLDREVAVAVIATAGLDEAGHERIRREAQAMARLGSHPNIVTVHDFGQEGELAYIVSEYMARGAVADRLAETQSKGLPIDDSVRLSQQVCEALAHAHKAGLVHRDVKPANVFLNADGDARLGDFGVALAVDRPRMTAEGGMVGTLDYMPPEQALGRPVDGRSDLYSLGAMLYELVCGRPPFRGDDMVAVVAQHINTPPVAPSWHNGDVPPALEGLILKLLAKDPDERPASAAEVGVALERLMAQPATVAPTAAEESNPLGRLAQGAFVGRRDELERLRGLVDETVKGRGRLALLAGEAGIGKTRTVEEVAAYAGLRGARVLWGRCYEGDGAPAYWPWLQLVRGYLAARPKEAWQAEMGSGAGAIARVVGEVGDPDPAVDESPEQARFRFFEAMGHFLSNAAHDHPLVLVLDDLHWADAASLLLLGFLAREVSRAPVLVVGTYRGGELSRDHPLTRMLGELGSDVAEWIALEGLAEEDVARFIEARAGVSASAKLVHAAHDRTDGNPFFLSEIVRLLVSEGGLSDGEGAMAVPQGVREVLGRRLDRLSDDARAVLDAAAVIGRDFRLDVLQRVAGLPSTRVLDVLDEATEAQVVTPGKMGRFRFAHALVREAIHDELGTVRRLRLHLDAAEALEAIHARAREAHSAELAHHFFEALHIAGPDKAVDYSVIAARRSHDALAYEEAALHYDRACRALELAGMEDDPRCIDLLLARGEEETHAGEVEPSQASFRDAAELARALGSPDLQARAALGFAQWSILGPNDPAIGLLEEALDALPTDDSACRAEVLAELAIHLPTDHRERKDQLSGEAVEMTRRVGEAGRLALLLALRHEAIWGPDNLEERLALADEDLALSLEVGDRSRVRWAHFLRFINLLERGNISDADRALDEFAATAEELGHPYHRWYAAFMRRTRALMDGRVTDAERLGDEARELWDGDPETAWAATVQDLALRWQQGRLAEVRPAAVEAVERYSSPAYRCLLAWIDAGTGHELEARRELERLAAGGFAELPRDRQWLAAVAAVAMTAAELGDERHAGVLAEALEPYARRVVLLDAGWGCLGPGARYLGLLAALAGDWPGAVERHEEAVELARAAGARMWLAEAQHDLARALIARGAPGDEERAQDLAAEALAGAVGMGLDGLADRVRTIRRAERAPTMSSVESMAMTIEAETPARFDGGHATPVTLLFSDIEGSTELNESLGDDEWMAVLEDHNAIVRDAVALHAGNEVKSQGDGFMLAFERPGDGLACAVAIQRAFARRNAERSDVPLRVRMGLHAGPAIRRGADFFGRNVVVAARIAAHATGGEILVSDELWCAVGRGEGEPRELALKGLKGTQRVHRIEWEVSSSAVTEGG